MKINLYMDVWPGCEIKYLTANTCKGYEKPEGHHRIKITVDIPDWMMEIPTQPDHVVTGTAVEV